jgi:predicted ATPase/class 3 adenylate cyclase
MGDQSPVTDLQDFLEAAGLADLHDTLVDHGIDVDVLGDLTDADLREIGINLGNRRRLLKAVAGGASPPKEPQVAAGDRRQVTVMFVDLVGFTSISTDSDAEDLREILAAYNRTCAEVVERHGGTVAQYLGDGILVYFGYPHAEEHSAERAVRAGLGVIETISGLVPVSGRRIHCRVAAATGTVVSGEVFGDALLSEGALLGEAPNLAARLQAVAEPDTMVIADRTRSLIGNLFECRALPPLALKGFPDAVAAHVVVREREVASRYLAAREGGSVPPLQGRDTELAALQAHWARAAEGSGTAVMLLGEAGIGKSRLAVALIDDVARGAGLAMTLSCQPQFAGTTLQPVLALLRRSAGIHGDDEPETQFRKLEVLLDGVPGDRPALVALFASMMKIPPGGLYAPPAESPQRQRKLFYAAMADWMQAMARGPLLLCIEDLHWADPTTVELVSSLLDGIGDRPMLLIATSRPDAGSPLLGDPRLATLPIERLESAAVAAIVANVAAGLQLPREVEELIERKSDGNPLFVEELTRSLLQSDAFRSDSGRIELVGPLARIATPATLHDTLMARLDRLPTARELAQIGAAIGREFTLDMVSTVAGQRRQTVRAGLGLLNDAGIVYERQGAGEPTFYFKHALLQEAAYDSLLRSRRRELHARIASAIEKLTPDEARTHPELMAHHLSRAGQHRQAIDFGMAAGLTALTRSANAEAVVHTRACLDWLTNLPEGEERDSLELGVNALLTPALMVSLGYVSPDVEACARRGLELLDALGERPEMFGSLSGLQLFHHVRSERAQARAVAERFVALAERLEDASQMVAGLALLAQCSWIEGDHADAERLLRRGIATFKSSQHDYHAHLYGFDSFCYCRITLSQVLWITGRSSEALAEAEAALAHARAINHANSIGMALLYMMLVRQQRGERAIVAALGRETAAFCERMGVSTPSSYAAIIANWAAGDVDGSLQIFAIHDAIGAQLGMTYYRSLAADNALDAGEVQTARAILAPALEQAATTGERYWQPQLGRLVARSLVAEGDEKAAAATLVEAAAEARRMGATMLEALALTDLLALGAADGEAGRRLDELRARGVELPAADDPATPWRHQNVREFSAGGASR